MKRGYVRARTRCYCCGKDVAVQYSGRSAAPGEPVRHNCPHGVECVRFDDGRSVTCGKCNEVIDKRQP